MAQQLQPQAQQGLVYLKTVNPQLAASIAQSFSSASSKPVDASIIGNTSNVVVPPQQQTPLPDFSKFQISNTARQNELEVEEGEIVSDITAATDKLATKNARKGELETAQGIPALSGQLNELNNQIRSVQSEAFAATNKSQDRLAPTFAITGEQAQIERQRAVKVYGLAAAAEAIQGNIALANDNVARALDAEFAGLEQEIETKKFLLTLNERNFNKEEARRAEAQQIALDQQKDALAQQRESRASILQIMMQAAQNGADNLTLNRIQLAKSPEEAISYAGQALGAEFEARMQQQRFENNLQLRSMALNEAKFTYQKIADQAATAGNMVTAQAAQDLTSVLGNGKIGQGTKTSIANILGVMNATEDLAKSRPDGKFAGYYPGAGIVNLITPNGFKRAETVQNEGYLDAINLKVQQWASGAALTVEQTKQVQRFTPAKNDSDRVVKAKLNNLTNFMQQQVKSALQSEGIMYEPVKVDLWAPQQTLADIFNQ